MNNNTECDVWKRKIAKSEEKTLLFMKWQVYKSAVLHTPINHFNMTAKVRLIVTQNMLNGLCIGYTFIFSVTFR
jgi:hypothetical protein